MFFYSSSFKKVYKKFALEWSVDSTSCVSVCTNKSNGDVYVGGVNRKTRYDLNGNVLYNSTASCNIISSACDSLGNYYFPLDASYSNHSYKIDNTLTTTLADYTQVNKVYYLALDSNGYVYASDYNGTIRKFANTGAGVNTSAALGIIGEMAVGADSSVYICDSNAIALTGKIIKLTSTLGANWNYTVGNAGVKIKVDNVLNSYTVDRGGYITKLAPNKDVIFIVNTGSPLISLDLDRFNNIYTIDDAKYLKKYNPAGTLLFSYLLDTVLTEIAVYKDSVYISATSKTVKIKQL